MRNVTMYICDGKMCKHPMYCKRKHKKNWLCAHTTDIDHAVNEPCKDPWNYPERFDKDYDKQTRTTYWVEKES